VGSPFNGLSRLRQIVARTNAAEPDLIFILGDLVVHGVRGGSFVPPEDIARELGALRSGAGTFAVLGNHDVWFDARRVEHALKGASIHVLEDRSLGVDTRAGRIWVAGVSDFLTRPHDVEAALAGVTDADAPVILLTHNPDVFPEIPRNVTITLAGHTHGGQVRFPLIENGRHLYVATGTGTSILPVRFRVPPAIVVLRIDSVCPRPNL
jgi:predicted MPP superfamily phosphohydrolase